MLLAFFFFWSIYMWILQGSLLFAVLFCENGVILDYNLLMASHDLFVLANLLLPIQSTVSSKLIFFIGLKE